MHGLKNVRNRHSDALTQVGWDQLEVMLAVHRKGVREHFRLNRLVL